MSKTLTLAQATSKLTATKAELDSVRALLSSTTEELTLTKTQLEQRTRLLEYVASILLDTQKELDKYPDLANPPSKITVWWVITHLGQVAAFVRFIIEKLKEFARNIKVGTTPDAPTV